MAGAGGRATRSRSTGGHRGLEEGRAAVAARLRSAFQSGRGAGRRAQPSRSAPLPRTLRPRGAARSLCGRHPARRVDDPPGALVSRAGALLGLPLLIAIAASCSTPNPPTAAPPPAAMPRANVLLVTIDTLRADRVGAYGGKTGVTPTL